MAKKLDRLINPTNVILEAPVRFVENGQTKFDETSFDETSRIHTRNW